MNCSSCNDHSPKWMINDCYIFFPYLRVWVFFFSADFFLYSTTRWSYGTKRLVGNFLSQVRSPCSSLNTSKITFRANSLTSNTREKCITLNLSHAYPSKLKICILSSVPWDFTRPPSICYHGSSHVSSWKMLCMRI